MNQIVWDHYWAEILRRLIFPQINEFNLADDIHNIRPDWASLSDEQKTDVMVEFFKAMVFYESGYNPKSSSVDVGIPGNKDTYSVGLLQLSVVDQSNLGLRFGFNYDDLMIPDKNLTLGVAIMVNQIKKRGKILIAKGEKGNPSLYWATISPGGRYDKSANIIEAAQALKFEHPAKLESEIPWYDVALGELGVTEVRGGENKRIIEYHSATTLKAKEDEISWCASFVCWCLKQAGYKHTASAWARDYLNYGTKCEPKKGCIMVFERGSRGGTSHVTFYAGDETADSYLCFGGNQGDKVCFKYYSKADLLGCRWPVKYDTNKVNSNP